MKNLTMQDVFAAAISLAVVIGFFAVLVLSYFRVAPDNATTSQLTGALTIAFGGVVAYWTGSSRSSQVKDGTIAQLAATQPALLNSPPPKP